ncbi:hypothetical protein F4803DRAFT_549577 [Xylaria telfairii]|nr:hypothetical protein F4803DRAFT_549577 [Xylaria telfairii]
MDQKYDTYDYFPVKYPVDTRTVLPPKLRQEALHSLPLSGNSGIFDLSYAAIRNAQDELTNRSCPSHDRRQASTVLSSAGMCWHGARCGRPPSSLRHTAFSDLSVVLPRVNVILGNYGLAYRHDYRTAALEVLNMPRLRLFISLHHDLARYD